MHRLSVVAGLSVRQLGPELVRKMTGGPQVQWKRVLNIHCFAAVRSGQLIALVAHVVSSLQAHSSFLVPRLNLQRYWLTTRVEPLKDVQNLANSCQTTSAGRMAVVVDLEQETYARKKLIAHAELFEED